LSPADPATLPDPAAAPSHWDDVRRIYRRVCVLREQGRDAEATSLEHAEFSRALSAARAASKAGDEEAGVLAAEAERVSTACLLAEMVAPLIAEQLRAELPGLAGGAVAVAKMPARGVSVATAPKSRPAPAAPPSITDLIDGMLSLESSAPASR
jgi:hypothetical protein